MKRIISLSVILLVVSLFTTSIFAQEQEAIKNQNMVKAQTTQGTQTQARNWVDADGDGICDNVGTGVGQQLKGANANSGNGKGNRKGGYGDGTGIRPQDGTGLGAGVGTGTGTGVCDGTGPKGAVKRSGRN
jgi:hypothetical protein